MITTKDELFENVDFVGRKKAKASNNVYDIGVYIKKEGRKTPRLRIYFRNSISDIFDSEYFEIGRYKNRLIIKPSTEENGVKLFNSQSPNVRSLQFTITKSEAGILVFGSTDGPVNYELKYDQLYEYYYIEKEDLK